jgi:hypothetical protein
VAQNPSQVQPRHRTGYLVSSLRLASGAAIGVLFACVPDVCSFSASAHSVRVTSTGVMVN